MNGNNKPLMVNPNTADVETLTRIPNIGVALAQRIVSVRPFDTIDDMQKVNGIGSKFLERIRPYLTLDNVLEPTLAQGEAVEPDANQAQLDQVPEEAAPQESEEAGIELEQEEHAEEEQKAIPPELVTEVEAEIEETQVEVQEPVEETEVEAKPEEEAQPEPGYVTMRQAMWLSIGSGLVALILALALSLGILAGLNNGGLQYASPTEMRTLSSQVDALAGQTDTLQQSLSGMRERVDNLETLSPRVAAVEDAAQDLRVDVDDAISQVGELSTQVEEVSTQVGALQEQASHFQGFFDGLRDLMDNVFPTGGEK